MPTQSYLTIDFETIEIVPDGTRASTEAYRENFRVDSLAATWRHPETGLQSVFIEGEEACRTWLKNNALDRPLIAHNLQFELLVSRCRFPELPLNWAVDTMRLAQVYDNGGDEMYDIEYVFEEMAADPETAPEIEPPKVKRKPTTGLGLVPCSKRILGVGKSHKEEAYAWLRANGVRKGKEGAHLHMLPKDILARYNIGDTEITHRLFEHCIQSFAVDNYDWTLDHELFLSTVSHLVNAKIRGVDVAREELAANLKIVEAEVAAIEEAFAKRFEKEIARIEYDHIMAWITKPKTFRGWTNRSKKVAESWTAADKTLKFNIGSNKQLAELFCGQLGLHAEFHTAKGGPSFKSSHLSQWGEGGVTLAKRRKRLLVAQQMKNLLALSEYDGKWHQDLRACGTSTGRFAGGTGG